MSETKYTSGPWGAEQWDGAQHWKVQFFGPNREWEGTVVSLDRSRDGNPEYRDRCEADARLIAAAPDLLAECQAMRDAIMRMALRLDSEPGNQTAVALWMLRVTAADAAIAKAEGR